MDEGLAGTGEPTILLAAVDWGDSALVRLRGRAIEPVADLKRTIAGKQYGGGQGEKDRKTYADELVGLLRREGPGGACGDRGRARLPEGGDRAPTPRGGPRRSRRK